MYGSQGKLMTLSYSKSWMEIFGNSGQNFLLNKYDFFHFGTKQKKRKLLLLQIMDLSKKTQKTPKSEIEKAEKIGKQYFKEKGES